MATRGIQTVPMTAEEFYALPDGEEHLELVAGWVVSEPLPGGRHGSIAANFVRLLGNHVQENELGAVFANDTGFVLARGPDTVRGPDVAFVRRERIQRTGIPEGSIEGPPDLAIEVLSPSNTRADIHAKVADYLAAGTPMVWIVDPRRKTVTVHRELLSPREVAGEGRLEGEDVVPGFSVSLPDIFES